MLRRFAISPCAYALLCLVSALPLSAGTICEGAITCFAQPIPLYTANTTLIDFSGLTDGTDYLSISGGGLTVTFDNPMTRLTVPNTWSTWNCPPATEASCTL